MIAKEILKLHNNWEFRQSGTNKWKPATVPGCVHTDLLALNEIEDPFYGSNAKKLQWIEEKNWEYRCLFDPPANMLEKNVIELNFNGLDTIATVYLNGTQIIRADNMHRKHVSSVKGRLIEGKNEIRVIFSSPYIKGLKKLEAYGFQLPASNEEVKHKVSPYIRKAAYMFTFPAGTLPRLKTCKLSRATLTKITRK